MNFERMFCLIKQNILFFYFICRHGNALKFNSLMRSVTETTCGEN
jgi:hypothetical protein